jgi:hypothetical protein
MGKKYIVELESGTHIFILGPEGITHIGEPDVVYNTVDGMQIGDAVINAIPYTEPDLEQVKKEAYDKGYDDAAEEIGSDEQAIADKAYKNGLSDAWEAARKVALSGEKGGLPTSEYCEIFGHGVHFSAGYSKHSQLKKSLQKSKPTSKSRMKKRKPTIISK